MLGDLIQSGMMGLLDAARRHESKEGAQFETYAVQRIRGAILDTLRQSDWAPRSVRASRRRFDSTIPVAAIMGAGRTRATAKYRVENDSICGSGKRPALSIARLSHSIPCNRYFDDVVKLET